MILKGIKRNVRGERLFRLLPAALLAGAILFGAPAKPTDSARAESGAYGYSVVAGEGDFLANDEAFSLSEGKYAALEFQVIKSVRCDFIGFSLSERPGDTTNALTVGKEGTELNGRKASLSAEDVLKEEAYVRVTFCPSEGYVDLAYRYEDTEYSSLFTAEGVTLPSEDVYLSAIFGETEIYVYGFSFLIGGGTPESARLRANGVEYVENGDAFSVDSQSSGCIVTDELVYLDEGESFNAEFTVTADGLAAGASSTQYLGFAYGYDNSLAAVESKGCSVRFYERPAGSFNGVESIMALSVGSSQGKLYIRNRYMSAKDVFTEGADIRAQFLRTDTSTGVFNLYVKKPGERNYSLVNYVKNFLFRRDVESEHEICMAMIFGGGAELSGSGLRFYKTSEAERDTALAFTGANGTAAYYAENDVSFSRLSLSVSAAEGGSAEGPGKEIYRTGETVTVTAAEAEGYVFRRWEDSHGNPLSTEKEYSFEMPFYDVGLKAVFEKGYKITAYLGAEKEAAVYYAAEGQSVRLTPAFLPGYKLKRWIIDGEQAASRADGSAVFSMPARDIEVYAVYETAETEFSVTVAEKAEDGHVALIATACVCGVVLLAGACVSVFVCLKKRKGR